MYWLLLPTGVYLNLHVVHEIMVVGTDVKAINGAQDWVVSSHLSVEEAQAALIALMQRMGQG